MNASHHGSDEEVDLPMNGGQPSCSDLPISGGPGMNPSHHGSDEQVFGAKQQFCTGAILATAISPRETVDRSREP